MLHPTLPLWAERLSHSDCVDQLILNRFPFITWYLILLHFSFMVSIPLSGTSTVRRFSTPSPVFQATPNWRTDPIVANIAWKAALCIIRFPCSISTTGLYPIWWCRKRRTSYTCRDMSNKRWLEGFEKASLLIEYQPKINRNVCRDSSTWRGLVVGTHLLTSIKEGAVAIGPEFEFDSFMFHSSQLVTV